MYNKESALKRFGIKPVIKASYGKMTVLGGSVLSPTVRQAMDDASRYFIDMEDLLNKSGQFISGITGSEDAYVTSGCAAAITLATAACMTGDDVEKMERLPNVEGMKYQVVIQSAQRYKYDRCITTTGAELVEAGDKSGTSRNQLEAVLNSSTAALYYVAPGREIGVLPIEQVIEIGKDRNIPVIVDAAKEVYPIEHLRKYSEIGADMVCYGGKYVGGPSSTGILCGRKDLVDSAKTQGFIGFETSSYRTIGRAMKVDKQNIIGLIVALDEWVNMDHQARIRRYKERMEYIADQLGDIHYIQMNLVGNPVTALSIKIDPDGIGKKPNDVADDLKNGNPSIWINSSDDSVRINAIELVDGDEKIIAQKLRESLISFR